MNNPVKPIGPSNIKLKSGSFSLIVGIIVCVYVCMEIGPFLYTSYMKSQTLYRDVLVLKDKLNSSELKRCELIQDTTETINILRLKIAAFGIKDNKKLLDSIYILSPRIDPILAVQIQQSIIKHSKYYVLPPLFVLSVINRESTLRPLVVSKVGCLGLMQINPKAHTDKFKKMGITESEVFHVDNNIKLGCWVLRDYINQYKDVEKALKKYVGGNLQVYVDDIFTTHAILAVNLNIKKIDK